MTPQIEIAQVVVRFTLPVGREFRHVVGSRFYERAGYTVVRAVR